MLIYVCARSVCNQVVGVAREEYVTAIRAHAFGDGPEKNKPWSTAVSSSAVNTHETRLAGHHVSQKHVTNPIGVIGHQVAGETREEHIASIIADPSVARREAVAAVSPCQINVHHSGRAGNNVAHIHRASLGTFVK